MRCEKKLLQKERWQLMPNHAKSTDKCKPPCCWGDHLSLFFLCCFLFRKLVTSVFYLQKFKSPTPQPVFAEFVTILPREMTHFSFSYWNMTWFSQSQPRYVLKSWFLLGRISSVASLDFHILEILDSQNLDSRIGSKFLHWVCDIRSMFVWRLRFLRW